MKKNPFLNKKKRKERHLILETARTKIFGLYIACAIRKDELGWFDESGWIFISVFFNQYLSEPFEDYPLIPLICSSGVPFNK